MAKEESNPVGRPPIHTDPIHLSNLVKDYFQWIEGEYEVVEIKENDDDGNETKRKEKIWSRHPEPPTVTGLTIHLGFSHKSSLYEYAEKPEFTDPIKKGLTLIEKYHEIKAAYGDKCVGNIFVLKNFGWTDRVEHEVNSKQEIVWHEEKTYEANNKANSGS